ncbi:MAG: hypothetical protein ACFFDT_22915 [Candidatus Hodarchaeota archaeon]
MINLSVTLEKTVEFQQIEEFSSKKTEQFIQLMQYFAFKGEIVVVNYLQKQLMKVEG